MSKQKYMIIDSSYRDRNQYPNPADFEFSVNNNNNELITSYSSISVPYPNTSFTIAYPVKFIDGSINLLGSDVSNVFQIEGINITTDTGFVESQDLSTSQNAYAGKILELINDDLWETIGTGYTTQYSKILESSYNTEQQVVEGIYIGFPYLPHDSINNRYFTQSLYDRLPPDDYYVRVIFLDPRSSDIDNYYNNKTIIVTTDTASESRTIISYDGLRRRATLNTPIPVASENYYNIINPKQTYLQLDNNEPLEYLVTPLTTNSTEFVYPSRLPINYSSNDPTYIYRSIRQVYRIRDSIPFFNGKITTSSSNKNIVTLPSDASSVDDYYKNMWLFIHNEYRVVEFNTIDSLGSGWITFNDPSTILGLYLNVSTTRSENYYVGMKLAIYVDTGWNTPDATDIQAFTGGLITSSDTNNPVLVTIDGGLPVTVQAGMSFFILKNNPNCGQYRFITEYDGVTKIATFLPLDYEILEGDTFDILNTKTIENKLNAYTSVVTNQETCVNLDIQSLSLPNQFLDNGNRIAFYPYIYVEIKQENQSQNIIFSNNPAARYALIKIPIYNVISPASSAFVSLDGRQMKVYTPFNINDKFHLRILLPNGDVFTTYTKDTELPEKVNQLLQIGLTLTINY